MYARKTSKAEEHLQQHKQRQITSNVPLDIFVRHSIPRFSTLMQHYCQWSRVRFARFMDAKFGLECWYLKLPGGLDLES